MSRVASFIALLLVFVLTPGAVELAENVAHMATEGHGAHAFDDAEHTPGGDEHGCSGTFHACSCHGSPVFVVGHGALAVSAPVLATPPHLAEVSDQPVTGYDLDVFRPPNARCGHS